MGVIYLIEKFDARPEDWRLAVKDAYIVFRIIRSGWNTMNDIVRGLLRWCIRFRIVFAYAAADIPRILIHLRYPNGLGIRNTEFQATTEDYGAYEAKVVELLRTSYGGGIYRLGGIIGRIARDILSEIEVLQGPRHCDLRVMQDGSGFWVDDYVTTEMLDVVSGVYHVQNFDDTDTGKETYKHASWCPKYWTWLKCGFNLNEWTPDAETFYQDRLAKIRAGEAQPLSASDWKAKLRRYQKHTQLAVTKAENFATSYAREILGLVTPRSFMD